MGGIEHAFNTRVAQTAQTLISRRTIAFLRPQNPRRVLSSAP